MKSWLNIVQSSLIIFLLLPLPGIASEKIISVKSYKINSISSSVASTTITTTLSGLVEAIFSISEISALIKTFISLAKLSTNFCQMFWTVFKKEKAILDVSMEDIYLSKGVVNINANVTIIYRKGTSICSLICNLLFGSLDDYSADVSLLCTMPDQEKSQVNRHIKWLDVSNP